MTAREPAGLPLPVTTLFLLMSLDRKISTGPAPDRDFDKDLPLIPGVGDGLAQHYRLERETDLVSLSSGHPAFGLSDPNLSTRYYDAPIDFVDLFGSLKNEGVDRLTVQSGGQLNAELLRAGLIDRVSVTVAPLLVGGGDTPTLVDGPGAWRADEFSRLARLKLVRASPLEHSHLRPEYDVIDSLAGRGTTP